MSVKNCPPGQVWWVDECADESTAPADVVAAYKATQKTNVARQNLAARNAYRPPPPVPKRKVPKSPPVISIPPATKAERSAAAKKEDQEARKKQIEDFYNKYGGTIFWTVLVACTVGMLSYYSKYPTDEEGPKALSGFMDFIMVIIFVQMLYVLRKWWKRYDSSKASDEKKRLFRMYIIGFLFGLGYWMYYHFGLRPKYKGKKLPKVANFFYHIAIPVLFVCMFALHGITM